MLKRSNYQNHDPAEVRKDGNQSNSFSLLAVMGSDAKLEGKFDIAESIEIECEVGVTSPRQYPPLSHPCRTWQRGCRARGYRIHEWRRCLEITVFDLPGPAQPMRNEE